MVTTAPGIGHVGIVIDDAPTAAATGAVGAGNASVRIQHAYGNVALALSTKAPSAFASIAGGLLPSHGPHAAAGAALAAGAGAAGAAQCDGAQHGAAAAGMDGDEMVAADAALPAMLEWMRPLAAAVAPLAAAAARARAL